MTDPTPTQIARALTASARIGAMATPTDADSVCAMGMWRGLMHMPRSGWRVPLALIGAYRCGYHVGYYLRRVHSLGGVL